MSEGRGETHWRGLEASALKPRREKFPAPGGRVRGRGGPGYFQGGDKAARRHGGSQSYTRFVSRPGDLPQGRDAKFCVFARSGDRPQHKSAITDCEQYNECTGKFICVVTLVNEINWKNDLYRPAKRKGMNMEFLRKLFARKEEQIHPAVAPPPRPEIVEISPADLMKEWQTANRPILLDVRESYEWQQMHVPNSLHVPMNQIPASLGKLNKEANIVVICATGSRSYSVTAFLAQNGFKVRNLRGGIMRWHQSGGEVVAG